MKQELKQKLQTAAEQYDTKLQAEINKGTRLRLTYRHSLFKRLCIASIWHCLYRAVSVTDGEIYEAR